MSSGRKQNIPMFRRPVAANTARVVGFVLIGMAVLNTGQIVQEDENDAKKAKQVEALYVALAKEQAALREAGKQPTAPDPRTILETPDVVFGSGHLAEGG